MEVGVQAGQHLRLLPDQGVHAEHGLPVELDQGGLTGGVQQPEGVHPEALHGAVGARDAAVGHVPDRVVLRLGVQRDEVPERVVSALRLRDLAVRVRLAGVDDVGELDPVLDEEHRDVVADEVEGALRGVELRREATGVTDRVGRPAGPEHRREPHEDRGRHALAEEARPADPVGVAVADEDAVRAGAACVHHPLGDALVVEVRDLLAQVVVLQQRRAALARLQRVVGVAQPQTLGRRQERALLSHVGRGGLGLGTGRRTPVGAGLVRLGRQRALRLRRLLEARRLRRRSTRDLRGVLAPSQRGERRLGGSGDGLLGGLDDGSGDLAGVGHVVSSVGRWRASNDRGLNQPVPIQVRWNFPL